MLRLLGRIKRGFALLSKSWRLADFESGVSFDFLLGGRFFAFFFDRHKSFTLLLFFL